MYPDRPERYISLVVRLFLPAFNTRFHCCLLRSGRLSTDSYRSILFIDCQFIILFFFSPLPFVFFLLLPCLFLSFLLVLRYSCYSCEIPIASRATTKRRIIDKMFAKRRRTDTKCFRVINFLNKHFPACVYLDRNFFSSIYKIKRFIRCLPFFPPSFFPF